MAKKISKEKRSYIMSRIRSENTGVEVALRSALWRRKLRFRIHYRIKWKPDIVFPSRKIAIFVDGDFWHGYDWSKLRKKLKNEFWKSKILTNRKRDRKVNSALNEEGWKVMRFWEHEIKNNLVGVVGKISREIKKH